MKETRRIRVVRGYQRVIDGEIHERLPGQELEEEAVLAAAMVSANKALALEPLVVPQRSGEPETEAATAEAPERAARAGRASGRG